MLLYGVLVISTIDNILKPLILKGAARIHTLLGFLSILGGLYALRSTGPAGGSGRAVAAALRVQDLPRGHPALDARPRGRQRPPSDGASAGLTPRAGLA